MVTSLDSGTAGSRSRPGARDEDLDAIRDVVASGFLIQGPHVAEFEKAVATMTHTATDKQAIEILQREMELLGESASTREREFDWKATIHEGGHGRGFSEIMPSFAEALTNVTRHAGAEIGRAHV